MAKTKAERCVDRNIRKKVKKKLRLKNRAGLSNALLATGFQRIKGETNAALFARFIGADRAALILGYSQKKYTPKTPAKRIGAPHPEYKRDDDFYSSRQWRELRYLALKNTDGRCQCCGGSAKDGLRIHVDHIQPRYKRPDLSLCLDNLQVLCEDCNYGKGAWDSTDWRVSPSYQSRP